MSGGNCGITSCSISLKDTFLPFVIIGFSTVIGGVSGPSTFLSSGRTCLGQGEDGGSPMSLSGLYIWPMSASSEGMVCEL